MDSGSKPDRHERIGILFVQAIDLPSGERAAFLDRVCGGDAGLRADVERLIDADSSNFLRAPNVPRLNQGFELAGRFRVLRFIAAGGMGDVYEVEDLELHENVALKTIRPELIADSRALARFKREIQYAKRVTHPNVCRIYDLGSHSESGSQIFFLTMEMLHGETLAEHLRHCGRMTLPEALPLITQMAGALTAAHQAGIVHRDFKPSNVILADSGKSRRAVVTDFGLARSSATTDDASLTETGKMIGTLPYMAPEQLTHGEVTAATDVYALGLAMYEMVTGHRPFEGTTPFDSAMKRLSQPPAPPASFVPELDSRWEAAILKCLELKPERRFQTPAEVTRALASDGQSTESLTSIRRRGFPRPPYVWALLTLLLVAAVVMAWVWWPVSRPISREALHFYQEGVNALRDGTYFKASKALEQAVRLAPHYAMAHAHLAEAWMELDSIDKAREELLLANPPGPHKSLVPSDELYLEALHSTLTADLSGAVAKYQEILKQTPEVDLANAYLDLGRAFQKNEKPNQAIRNYEEAVRRKPECAAALLWLGGLYARAQDTARSAAAFDRAETIYQSLSNIEGVIQVADQRAHAADSAGRTKEASELAQKTIALARTAGSVNQQIVALLGLAGFQFTLGDPIKGRESATEAMDLARKNGLENLTTRGLIQVGNAAVHRGELEQAIGYFNSAIEYALRYKAVQNEMLARFSLASALIQQGNAEEGARQLEPALKFFEQGGYRTETMQTLVLLTRARRKQGDFDGALKTATQLLKNAKHTGNKTMLAYSEQSVGGVLSEQEHFPEALAHFEQARVPAEELGNKTLIGYVLSNIGTELGTLGRYAEAQDTLKRALSMADRPGGDKSLKPQIELTLAEIALSRLRSGEARAGAARALGRGSEDQDVAIEGRCVLALAGSGKQAAEDADEAVRLAELSKSPPRISKALFASAAAHLESGSSRDALDLAMRSHALFARSGQIESEWRVSLIAARAANALGDKAKSKEFASQAGAELAKLETGWPPQDFKTYLARPDIQRCKKQLSLLSPQ